MLKSFTMSRSKSVKGLTISPPVSPVPGLPTFESLDMSSGDKNNHRHHQDVYHTNTSSQSHSSSTPRSHRDSSIILMTKFDFKAEHKNELTVGVGEALKLLERKGNGWILVKPIGRISDAGLIPASYVKIVRLGKNDVNGEMDIKWLSEKDQYYTHSTKKSISSSKPQEKKLPSIAPPTSPLTSSQPPSPHTSVHPKTSSSYKQMKLSTSSLNTTESSESGEQHFSFQSASTSSTSSESSEPVPVSGLVRNASSFNGRYWYRVDITMSDGKKRFLCRYYQDFYKLHCSILDQLDGSFDDDSILDKLPTLPDPIPRPDLQTLSTIVLQRCQSLNVYIFKIVQNKNKLDYTKVLTDWTAPKMGDIELNKDTVLSNEAIEDLLKPMTTVTKKQSTSSTSSSTSSITKPALTIQTSVTPPLPAPQQPYPYYYSSRSGSISSMNSFSPSLPSPKVWGSPTTIMHSPPGTPNKERSKSTPFTIKEEEETRHINDGQDWMMTPTEPLFSKKRNFSAPAVTTNSSYKFGGNIEITSSSDNSPRNSCGTSEKNSMEVKAKIYFNGEIFALRLLKDQSTVESIKLSICKRLEFNDVGLVKLYYKPGSKNYFLPLVDHLDLINACEESKVSIRVQLTGL